MEIRHEKLEKEHVKIKRTTWNENGINEMKTRNKKNIWWKISKKWKIQEENNYMKFDIKMDQEKWKMVKGKWITFISWNVSRFFR